MVGYKKQRFLAVSVLPVLDCMRMIFLMDNWYKSGYDAQTQIVESGCILIALMLTVRVRCTSVLYATTFFDIHLAVFIAFSITVYLYSHLKSSVIIFACDFMHIIFYHYSCSCYYVCLLCMCSEMNIQYLVSVIHELLRVPLWRWLKIDVQEVLAIDITCHWPIIVGSVDHTSLNIAA